jgi:multicomponent Na+:H+ antiporter subunit B
MKFTAFALTIFAAGVLFKASSALPPFGDPGSPAATHVSPRYIEQGAAETGATNLVTGVLADYRGYDTLGETTVIFTAGLACLLIVGAGASWSWGPRRR